MTVQEFSDQFDVLYNNITSNQAPGLNEYEKSVFLTKAEKEIVKNYFSAGSMGNTLHQGFDDSAKRQADFSILMKTDYCTPVPGAGTVTYKLYTCSDGGADYPVTNLMFCNSSNVYVDVPASGTPYAITVRNGMPTITYNTQILYVYNWPSECDYTGQADITITTEQRTYTDSFVHIDPRSSVFTFPDDVFIVINEVITTTAGRYLQVIPLRYDEYTRLMSKPFKYPVKNQAWRLMHSGDVHYVRAVEIVTNTWDIIADDGYCVRYIKTPKPIILANIGDLKIDGLSTPTNCELDPILHEEILQRAVELAKVAWTSNGQENVQLVMEAGKRSE